MVRLRLREIWNLLLLRFLRNNSDFYLRHTFSSENVTVHRCFLPIIFSSYFGNRDSMKTGTYEEKFVYYVLPFLLAGTYVKKVLYYVLCKCHNRTYWTFSCPYVPFDFCRRTFLLSFCLYVPYRYHSRTFQAPFHPYIPFVLHKGICPFFFICPILFFWQTFCIEEL